MDSEIRDKDVTIPFVAFERAEAAYERHIKRLWILCIFLLVLLVGSNIGWLCFISAYDFSSYSADVDTGEKGNVNYNYIGEKMDGDIINGTGDSQKDVNDETERSEGSDDKNAG